MTLRSGHGTGTGVPRIEVLPADELPAGVPASAPEERPSDRGLGGRFAPANTIARSGGRARAGKTRLAHQLGLAKLADESAFAPYIASAENFRRAQCASLAQSVGGGMCGPGPSSLVATAALQLAWSRFLSDVAAESGDAAKALSASRLGEASRQSLLAAHELCAREAKARPRKPAPWMALGGSDDDEEETEQETSPSSTDPPAALPSATVTTAPPSVTTAPAKPRLPPVVLDLPKGT